MTALAHPDAGVHLGIDVGGTFTDIVVTWSSGAVRSKVPSTPEDPAAGVLAACREAADLLGWDLTTLLQRLERFGLGTTVVTNVLATASGRRLGLITTAGFEDLIPLSRGHRQSQGGWLVPPHPLVERDQIAGVHERCDRVGSILRPVDSVEVEEAAARLIEEGAESLVISFLWSFRNPENERSAGEAVVRRFPEVPVTLGSTLAPVIREFERTQLALLNAHVGGALDWLGPLDQSLRDQGLATGILLMHSNGGAVPLPLAAAVPIGLAQSGPAAGAAAATRLAHQLHETAAVTCDMGGTSLDVALISGGEALRRNRGRVMGQWTALSMVDVDSVGSGGGSIAWTDALGGLRVGPASVGAQPGPACYGRGGQQPTVTDALLLLGYIDPARFLGGRMQLDPDRARAACQQLGKSLGLDADEVAWGIREIALARMAKAIRNRLATRGLAATDLGLVAFGGCGPLFGADIAQQISAKRCIVPHLASVFSAYGAATCVIRRERAASLIQLLPIPDSDLRAAYANLWEAVTADLLADGYEPSACHVRLEADLRFERQGWELTIPLVGRRPEQVEGAEIVHLFRQEYAVRYGEGALSSGVRIELVTIRASGTAGEEATPNGPGPPTRAEAGPPVTEMTSRLVTLERGAPPVTVAVLDWDVLPAAWTVDGPALLDARDTSAWVPAGYWAGPASADSIQIARRQDG